MNKQWKRRGICFCLAMFVMLTGVLFSQAMHTEAASAIVVKYSGKKYTYSTKQQTKAKVNGKKVTTEIPGLIVNGTNLVSPTVFQTKALGITYKYKKSTKVVTLKKNDTTIKITMGKKNAKVNGKTVSMGTKALRMYHTTKKKYYNMIPARFVIETFGMKYTWKQSTRTCVIKSTVSKPVETPEPEKDVVSEGAITASGTAASGAAAGSNSEMRAMWISYLEYGSKAKNEKDFTNMMNTMFDNCVSYGMNTVIVQVRPYSDAMYPSAYFLWSKYVSGKLGTDPGYDPLQIMVTLAHQKGLQIQAWINPYRVTTGSTAVSSLPDGHPAKVWRNSADTQDKRNVLSYSGNLYYNPSSEAVQNLIVNGVKEIVQNYDVDGIHFDDYFYPNLGISYTSNFDAKEYNAYVANCEAQGIAPGSIVQWRRQNVDNLVQKVYTAVKSTKPNVVFGISPAGNIDNLMSNAAYYVNVGKWMSNTGYVDYICPQIYWSFQNKTCPFAATVDRWAKLKTSDSVKLYIGIAVYRAGSTGVEDEWTNSDTVLQRQITYGRGVNQVSGFAFYRYDSFLSKATQSELANLLPLLKNQ